MLSIGKVDADTCTVYELQSIVTSLSTMYIHISGNLFDWKRISHMFVGIQNIPILFIIHGCTMFFILLYTWPVRIGFPWKCFIIYVFIYLVWLIVKLRRKSCSLSLCSRFLTTWFYVRTHGKVFACHLVRSSLEKYMYVRARIPKLFSKRKYLTSKNDELWSKDVRRNESNLSTNDFFSEKEKINIIGRLLLYCARKDDDLWIYTFKLATVR